MVVEIGYAEGTCSRCGKTLRRRRPADYGVCDCYQHCPVCTTNGQAYTVKMDPYTPDLTPSTYGPIKGENAMGDTEAPIKILYRCPKCGYFSAQLPVEVRLT